jgi:arsenite methyltransferase
VHASGEEHASSTSVRERGLLALEAARRVGETGTVIALDISHDALIECRRMLVRAERAQVVVGDALSLPVPDGCVDAVVTRSVLIYVVDKAGRVSESLCKRR